ncbi:unnamed protein product, partial [Staurois parvus]
MEEGRKTMVERILSLTMEFIYLMTGEEYTMVKKTSGDHVTLGSQSRVSGEWSRNRKITMEPPPHCLIPERNNDKKIVEVINKITELLTGEVPLRCQDIAVYFSMEEWEYMEGHKDLYKDPIMEDQQTFPSPDVPVNRNNEEQSGVLSPNGEIKAEDLMARSSEGSPIAPNLHQSLPCEHASSDPPTLRVYVPDHGAAATHPTPPTMGEGLSSSGLGGRLTSREEEMVSLQASYVEDKPNSRNKYQKRFFCKPELLRHDRVYRVEKLYSCSKCG